MWILAVAMVERVVMVDHLKFKWLITESYKVFFLSKWVYSIWKLKWFDFNELLDDFR